MKEHLLSLIQNPLYSFVTSSITMHGVFCLLSVMIAMEFNEIEHFIENHNSWSEKSFP